ncbi:MAG: iron ABC transporter permease [Pseudomonadota bacterium]
MSLPKSSRAQVDDRSFSLALPRGGVLLLLALGVASVGATLLSVTVGSFPVSATDALLTLVRGAPSEMAETVVMQFRLPRALVAVVAGGLLAGSGAILQNVARNPLADPSLVGVSQGASVAVVTLIVMFPGMPYELRPAAAILGALAAALIIQLSSNRDSGSATLRFILTGVAVAAFLSAVTGAMLTYGDVDRAVSAMTWLAGSLATVSWDDVWLLSLFVLTVMPALCWASRPLRALRMGREIAISLGASFQRDRLLLVLLAVLLAAVAVSTVGPVGFVGLIAPHLARMLARTGPGLHLFLSMAIGGLLLACADLLGRGLFEPIQIPAGLVTALLGAPFFAYLLISRRGT